MEYFEQRTIEFRNRLNQRFFGNTGIAQVDDDRAGITVLSYNVGNGLAPPARLARYLAESDADIIGLQELSVPQAEVIEKLLVEHYPYRLLVPTGFSGKGS